MLIIKFASADLNLGDYLINFLRVWLWEWLLVELVHWTVLFLRF